MVVQKGVGRGRREVLLWILPVKGITCDCSFSAVVRVVLGMGALVVSVIVVGIVVGDVTVDMDVTVVVVVMNDVSKTDTVTSTVSVMWMVTSSVMKTVTPAFVVTVRILRPLGARGARVMVGGVEFDMLCAVEWVGVFVWDFFFVGSSSRGEGRRETDVMMD